MKKETRKTALEEGTGGDDREEMEKEKAIGKGNRK